MENLNHGHTDNYNLWFRVIAQVMLKYRVSMALSGFLSLILRFVSLVNKPACAMKIPSESDHRKH